MKNPESYWSYSLPGTNVNGFNSLPIDTQFRSVVQPEDVMVPPTPARQQWDRCTPSTAQSHKCRNPKGEPPKMQKLYAPKMQTVKKPPVPRIAGPLARPSVTKIYTRKRRLASTLNPPIFRFQRIKIMENGSKICLLPSNLKSRRKMRAILPLNNQKSSYFSQRRRPSSGVF